MEIQAKILFHISFLVTIFIHTIYRGATNVKVASLAYILGLCYSVTYLIFTKFVVIKTFNVSNSEMAPSPESLQCDSHASVIDFVTIFNNILPEKEEVFQDLQENFNQSLDFSQNLVAFHSKIIEIHQQLDEELNQQKIHNVRLTVEVEDIPNNESYERLESLTLKVSSQPWIFSQQDQVSIEQLKQDLNVASELNKKITNEENLPEINIAGDIEPSLKITYESIEFFNCQYTVERCKVSDLSFSNDVNVAKYEALSASVNDQVRDKITIHNFASSDTIEIELYPEKLGRVKIKCLIEEADKIVVEVSAEKLTTLAILQQNSLELKEIIDKNFRDNNSTQLNFQMSQDKKEENNQENNRSGYINISDEVKIGTTVHFLHNGIINLTV
jgi:hypothetical protein